MVLKYSLLAKLPKEGDACVGKKEHPWGEGQCAPGFKGLARGLRLAEETAKGSL